jgi:glycosyltransferase involved in cell wall biosynthesis
LSTTVVINGRFLTQAITGVQRFAGEIATELAKIRHDLLIVAPKSALLPPDFGGIRVVQTGVLGGHAWEQLELPIFLRKLRGPLLLGLTSTGPVFYRPQVTTQFDITYVRHPESFSRRFRALYRTLVPRVVNHSSHILTISDFSRGELIDHFGVSPDSVSVVPCAVGDFFSAPRGTRTEAPSYFLAVSSPNAHKNFSRLLDAFSFVRAVHPDVELWIVGSQAPSFARQSFDPHSASGVRFLGRVSDASLVDLYAGAVAFVFPSLYEGFGLPPLEAQSVGTPVIASNSSAMPEVLGSGGAFFVDPLDVGDIARALREVLLDEALRHRLVAAGLENVARYSWAGSAEVVSGVLDRVIAFMGSEG